jgi:hypothetical protein
VAVIVATGGMETRELAFVSLAEYDPRKLRLFGRLSTRPARATVR